MSLLFGGLDLSLTQTGYASVITHLANDVLSVEQDIATGVFKPKTKDYPRLNDIVDHCLKSVAHCDVVGVEGCIAHGKFVNMPLIGAWWIVARELTNAGVLWVQISPTSLKKYATGNGNADKFAMFKAAMTRLGADAIETPDEADAVWLAAAVADYYGEPLCKMPEVNRAALTALNTKKKPVIDWPALPSGLQARRQLEGIPGQ